MPTNVINDRYELLEPLDHGGMGDVWRGYDTVLDRPVAVKMVRQAAVTNPQLAEEFAKRFRREARITARIQHPGVPQVYDAVLDATFEHLFLVMELVDGLSLSAYIRPGHRLPISWAAAVAAQIATVLSHAHDVPVIHRDLKPGNVLVARDGTVKVLDFGIAAILRTDVTKLTATGSPIGTHQYMAPEQIRSGRITPATDLYALGCVLHELLAGVPVFTGDHEFALMRQHLEAPPAPLRQLRDDVPEDLEELVLQLLRKAPESRPADTQEVYGRLLPFLPVAGSVLAPDEAGPSGAPDPTGVFRHPYAPRSRTRTPPAAVRTPTLIDPAPVPDQQLRVAVKDAYRQSDALLAEERFTQAVEVLSAVIEPAARAFGSDSRDLLNLRKRRAVIRFLGGDYRAALPEFALLANVYARTAGPTSTPARECRAQAARCRAELGQVTEALQELQEIFRVVSGLDGDASEEAIDLRHSIAVLVLAQGRVADAVRLLEPLYEDLVMVYGTEDELAVEVSETLFRIGLDLDGPELG